MYSAEEIQKGIQWAIREGHYEALKNYNLANENNKEQKLRCLDEFELYTYKEVGDETDFDQMDEVVAKNVDFKYDLEGEIRKGSCFGLSCYIYELIRAIQA